jgi:hypothetical protein
MATWKPMPFPSISGRFSIPWQRALAQTTFSSPCDGSVVGVRKGRATTLGADLGAGGLDEFDQRLPGHNLLQLSKNFSRLVRVLAVVCS